MKKYIPELLTLALLISFGAFAAEPAYPILKDGTITATKIMSVTGPQSLIIPCQHGSVNFNFKTGATVYTDCTPDEGARALFRTFKDEIQRECSIQRRDTKP